MKVEVTERVRFGVAGPQRLPGGAASRPGGAVRLGHLTDLHFGAAGHLRSPSMVLRSWLEAFAGLEVDLVVVSGDLVERGHLRAEMQEARRVLDAGGLPWVVVPGNHDVSRPPLPGSYLPEFERAFGCTFPAVVPVGGIELLLLDSNREASHRRPLQLLSRVFAGSTCGRVGSAQLEALGALPPGPPRVLVLHHHLTRRAPDLVAGVSDETFGSMGPIADATEVLAWAKRHGVRCALYGHKHEMPAPIVDEDGLVLLNGGRSTQPREGRYLARAVDVLPGGDLVVSVVALEF